MIDWQILVNGSFPPGWDQHKDGCWFPNFETQRMMLPHFDVGDQPIDEYGKTVFDTDTVKRLKSHLEWQRGYYEGKPDSWSISESSGFQVSQSSFQREQILLLIDKSIALAARAIELNAEIHFFGD